jgi:hypothetical protein
MPRLLQSISPRSAILALGAFAGGACSAPTALSQPVRAVLVALGAPEAHVLGSPLEVTVTYELQACDRLLGVQGRVVGTILEVEVRKVYEMRDCPRPEPSEHQGTFAFATPPVGTVTVRGLQPEPTPPLEQQVTVTIE